MKVKRAMTESSVPAWAGRECSARLVAEPVGDPLAADLLEGLHDVGVVAEHEVDVGGREQGAGDRALGRRLVGDVLHAAVHARHHDVRAGPAGAGGVGEDAGDVGRVEDVDRPVPALRHRHAVGAEGGRDLGDPDAVHVEQGRCRGLLR